MPRAENSPAFERQGPILRGYVCRGLERLVVKRGNKVHAGAPVVRTTAHGHARAPPLSLGSDRLRGAGGERRMHTLAGFPQFQALILRRRLRCYTRRCLTAVAVTASYMYKTGRQGRFHGFPHSSVSTLLLLCVIPFLHLRRPVRLDLRGRIRRLQRTTVLITPFPGAATGCCVKLLRGRLDRPPP